jgi:multiple sugar transport system permease protein
MLDVYGLRRRRPLGVFLTLLALIVFAIWTLFPFFWALVTSFKQPGDSLKPTFIPYDQFQPTLYAWKHVFVNTGSTTFHALLNSIAVASISSAFVLLLGSLAGYGLARFRFKKWKNKDIAFFILSQRMFPPVAVLIPYFLIMQTLHLLDNITSIIIAHVAMNLPLAVWLMMDFFAGLPVELEEAALIDGCGRLRSFAYIALPLALPLLVAVYVLSFIFSWNDFIFVITFGYHKALTIPVLIAGSLSETGLEFWKVSALALIAAIPPVILAMFFSRYLVRGLTLGAVKG